MSQNISVEDLAAASVTWGGGLASALTEGAKKYKQEIDKINSSLLTDKRRYEIFAESQAKSLKNLSGTAYQWANAAGQVGNKGIGNIMRHYAEKALSQSNAVLDGLVDKAQWLDDVIKQANPALEAANKGILATGGDVGRAFGPIVDAAQMISGAMDYLGAGGLRTGKMPALA